MLKVVSSSTDHVLQAGCLGRREAYGSIQSWSRVTLSSPFMLLPHRLPAHRDRPTTGWSRKVDRIHPQNSTRPSSLLWIQRGYVQLNARPSLPPRERGRAQWSGRDTGPGHLTVKRGEMQHKPILNTVTDLSNQTSHLWDLSKLTGHLWDLLVQAHTGGHIARCSAIDHSDLGWGDHLDLGWGDHSDLGWGDHSVLGWGIIQT